MTESTPLTDEPTRRLRSLVRVFMSPAIWLLTAYQALMLSVLRIDWQNYSDSAVGTYGPIILAAMFLGFFFLAAGTYQSFVREQSLVKVAMVFQNARLIFTRFILLSIKVGLLGFLIINIVVIVAQGLTGMEPKEIFDVMADYLVLIVSVSALALVYWLPLVFVKGNFNMLETMREALLLSWARIHHVGFLAVLILLPTFLMWMVSKQLSPAISVLGSILGELLAWVAFAYCVDYLKTEYSPVPENGS